MSDIEGKAAGIAASECGQRVSFNHEGYKKERLIPSKVKTKLKVVAVALMTAVAFGSLTGLSSCQRQQESALKPIDKAALQTLVDTTAKELLIACSEFIDHRRVMLRLRT
jgi:hypothetical protein